MSNRYDAVVFDLDGTLADSLADIAFTSQMGRKFFEERRFVVAAEKSAASAALGIGHAPGQAPGQAQLTGFGKASGAPKSGRPVAFLFSGQGS